MQVSNANDIKIYSITSASKSAIPDWLVQKNKSKLRYDQAWRNRIELIQDFQFPEASIRLKVTNDSKFIMATGVYQPHIRVFDLDQMSMKFERHTNCENITFEILSDDWTKSIHLQADRTVEFHSHYGMHYQTRVPKFGRDLKYHYPSCDLLVVGASPDVWRLNLEQGRFMAPLQTSLPEINTLAINPAHQLIALGGSTGQIELWHPSIRKRIGSLDVHRALVKQIDGSLFDSLPEISKIEFGLDGLSLLCGTSTGQVVLYDLRMSTPLLIKDHQYGYPINSLAFHSSYIMSSDTKIVKFWDKDDGSVYANIEAPHDINNTCLFADSGLVMLANEGVQMQSYYIPALGPAPKWCPFLDNLTEELEENSSSTIYDDYKFVSRKELTQLSMDHLIGTNVLKAYMHGFFVDLRLYEKARAIANPFEFEEHKKMLVKKKIEEKRRSRIEAYNNLPTVNRALANELIDDVEGDSDGDLDGNGNSKKKKKNKESGIVKDERFASLFNDPDYQVDETSFEYKMHHPSESQIKKFDLREEDGVKFYELKDGFSATDRPGSTDDKLRDQRRAFGARVTSSDAGEARGRRTGNMSVSFDVKAKTRAGQGDGFKRPERKSGYSAQESGDKAQGSSMRGRGASRGRASRGRGRGSSRGRSSA